jgi:hypothetical protein
MTSAAGYFVMFAIEREFGLSMVIGDFAPAIDRVAKFASPGFNIFIDLTFMRILVTTVTASIIENKTYRLIIIVDRAFGMAGDTGNGQMASG